MPYTAAQLKVNTWIISLAGRDCSEQNLQELSANEPAPLEDSTPHPAAVAVDDAAR